MVPTAPTDDSPAQSLTLDRDIEHANKRVFERRGNSPVNEIERQRLNKRLARWGSGPSIAGDSIFWDMVRNRGIDPQNVANELSWLKRTKGVGRINSRQSWGRKEVIDGFILQQLPADFSPFLARLGDNKLCNIAFERLSIGSTRYQVQLATSQEQTCLFVRNTDLPITAFSSLENRPLGQLVAGLDDDRIMLRLRRANYLGYAHLRIDLERKIETFSVQDAQEPMNSYSAIANWPVDTHPDTGIPETLLGIVNRRLANKRMAVQIKTRSGLKLYHLRTDFQGPHQQDHIIIREFGGKSQQIQARPTANALFDCAQREWTVPLAAFIAHDLDELLTRHNHAIVNEQTTMLV